MKWNYAFFAGFVLSRPRLLTLPFRGVYVPAYVNFEFIRDFDNIQTVIDVGANEGHVSRALSALLPGAHVHSFEPMTEPFERLKRSGRGERFHANQVAVTDKVGFATLHALPSYSPGSSLFPVKDPVGGHPGIGGKARLDSVPTTTLDAYFESQRMHGRAFLKLDTQGSELLALKGAERTLESVDVIYCETSFTELYDGQCLFHEVYDFLRGHDFVYHGSLNESWFYPQFKPALSENSLFVRR